MAFSPFQGISRVKAFGESLSAGRLLFGLDPTTGKPLSETASSSGGFTEVGKTDSGKTVVRSNITGRTVLGPGEAPDNSSVNLRLQPAARALGPQISPVQLARKSDERRKTREKSRPRSRAGGGGTKSILSSDSILGAQSILG